MTTRSARPLSNTQRNALMFLADGAFEYSVAGWAPSGSGGLGAFSTQTIMALEQRGLARVYRRGKHATVKITGAGRDANSRV